MDMKYDVANIYSFLTQTPESGLRKMLVDNKPMSEVHFNMLMKITRACSEGQFTDHFEKKDFPKSKFSANEIQLKEKFWDDVCKTLDSRGLLTPAVAQRAA